jgi:hypothetical protein
MHRSSMVVFRMIFGFTNRTKTNVSTHKTYFNHMKNEQISLTIIIVSSEKNVNHFLNFNLPIKEISSISDPMLSAKSEIIHQLR